MEIEEVHEERSCLSFDSSVADPAAAAVVSILSCVLMATFPKDQVKQGFIRSEILIGNCV
jgi:hypothetical protein